MPGCSVQAYNKILFIIIVNINCKYNNTVLFDECV